MTKNILLGIFDDHPFFIEGLCNFVKIHDYISICFVASTKIELIEKLNAKVPDILIMDVLAPDVTGLELYFETVKKHPTIKIIAYTSLKSEILIESLLELGVKGYVNKNQPPDDLIAAIKDVHYYDLISVPEEFKGLIPKSTLTKSIFTPRELEILQLIALGKTSDAIAKHLNVSLRTIENIKLSLFKKLEVNNSAELVLVASRLGYVS